ncbi:MAG: BatA and WFA domain-containing protein [Victivallales bacterium]|nr:BatA and WFA domain-containing protein [Victivallales bacterium]
MLLAFLPLATLPLLLHLLSRQFPPRLAFPTTRFLLKSPRPQQGRRRWQDWLLMLCRMALIALLCLTIAGPRWTPKSADTPSDAQPPALALLLDTSASMLTHADQVRDAVKRLLTNHADWEIAIFAFAHSSNYLDENSLGKWEPGYSEGCPANAVRQATQWLSQRAIAAERRLAIISDFQRSNWSVTLPALPPETQLDLQAVPDILTSANVAITAVQPTPLSDSQLRLRVSWKNWGDQAQKRELRITLGSRIVTQNLELPPHAEGATAIVTEWSPAENHAVATLEPSDAFPADDQYFFWAQRNPPVPVLLLLPDSSSDGPLADELEFFLQRALTAERNGVPGHFTVQSLGASSLSLVDLKNFALVFLAGCTERLSSEDAPQLHDHLARGGSVIFLPGSAPVAAWRYLRENGFVSISEQGLTRQSTGLGEVPSKTLLAKIFPATAPSDLHLFTIRQFLRIVPSPNDVVLLQTLDSIPALIRHDAEDAGPFFAFTFAFHHEITDFTLTQSFLPILREVCADATQSHSETIRLHCGDAVPELHALDGTLLELELLENTERPGLARLGNHPVEINVSPQESQPERVDLDELRRVLLRVDNTAEAPAPFPDDIPAKGEHDLRIWGFAALAGLAVLELLLLLAGHPIQRDSEKHIFSTLWR